MPLNVYLFQMFQERLVAYNLYSRYEETPKFMIKNQIKDPLCLMHNTHEIENLLVSGNAQGKAHVSCERGFEKIGCFSQQSSGAYTMLINDRDTESPYNQGFVLDWKNIEESFHR